MTDITLYQMALLTTAIVMISLGLVGVTGHLQSTTILAVFILAGIVLLSFLLGVRYGQPRKA